MKDTIQTIRRSSRRFFSGTVISRISGMLRDMSMAFAFGTHPSIAGFMVAFRFAHLLRRLLGEGALQTAFIPEFETLRHENEKRAFAFFKLLGLALSLLLIALIGLSCAVVASFLWWGNLQPGNREILMLTLLMLPSLLFICLFGLNAAFLQCEKSYFIPSVAPVAFNGIWILFVFLLRGKSAGEAMEWLSFGVVVACLAQWLITLPQTWKKISSLSWLSIDFRTALNDLRRMGKPLFLGMVGVGASQINNAMDSLFALYADPEGPALLWYSIRIQQLPLALFGIAIAGAILPPLSRAIKGGRREEYHSFLQDGLTQTWTFMLPLTALIFVAGDQSVQFLYGRGDFGSSSVIQTTYCLWAYGLGLIPSALVLVLAPACYADKDYKKPALVSLGAMVLNLILNSLFIMFLGLGSISVAIATSLSAWVNFAILGRSISTFNTPLFSVIQISSIVSMSIASIFGLLSTYAVRTLLMNKPLFSPSLFSASLTEQVFMLLVSGFVFISTLIPIFFILRRIFFRKVIIDVKPIP